MIVEPSGMDVFTHLAWEEYLMEEVSGPVLMLWQSACAVVVGKKSKSLARVSAGIDGSGARSVSSAIIGRRDCLSR